MTALSPEPLSWTFRFQPGEGANESIEKPAGGVNSTVVVVAPSFSVGTASVKTWPSFASATGGLTRACADAPATIASAATTAGSSASRRRLPEIGCLISVCSPFALSEDLVAQIHKVGGPRGP